MTEYRDFYGIYLKADEEIVMRSGTSLTALVITWVSIPALLAIIYVPAIITNIVRSLFFNAAFGDLFGGIPTAVKVIVSIPIVILAIIWFFLCLTLTYRHFNYHLAITDSRVIGKAGAEELNSPLNEIVNVFIERSIWGKLLNYGAVTVQTKKKTLTFYNVESPEVYYDKIMSYAEDYCAH